MNRMLTRRIIATRFNLAITGVGIIASVVVGLTLGQIQNTSATRKFEEKATLVLSLMQKASVAAYANFEYGVLDNLAKTMLADSDVDNIVFADEKGRVVAQMAREGAVLAADQEISRRCEVCDANRAILGNIEIRFSQASLAKERKMNWVTMVTICAIAAAATLMIGVILSRSITGRLMEEELVKTSKRLELAAQAGGLGIWDYDVANNKLVWDEQMFRLYGIKRDQFGSAYEAWLACVHPEDRQRAHEEIQRALQGEKDFNTEFRALWPDGSIHCIRAMAIVQRDASGQVTHMIGTNWDITAVKQAEELLIERAALLEAQTNASPDGVLVISENQKRVLINQRIIEMFDVPQDVLHDDDNAVLLKHVVNLTKHPEIFLEKVQYLYNHRNEISRDEIEFKSGMVLYRYSAPVLGKNGENYGRIWTFRDITERKKAENELHSLNQQLEQRVQERTSEALDLYNNAPCGYHSWGPDGVVLQINDTELKWLGYQREEVEGRMRMSELLTPNNAERFSQIFHQLVNSENQVVNEWEARRKDGSSFNVMVSSNAVRDADGRFLKTRSTVIDITERKRAEELSRQLSERLSLATRAGDVGIWDYDVLNNKLIWDEQMFRLYGITRDEFGSAYEAWLAGVHPDDRQRGDQEIQLALRGEKKFDTEFRVLWPDGSTHYIRALATVRRDASGQATHMVGTNWDITEQKRAEEALCLAKDAANLANLAKSTFLANMSHEIRTPMNAILGFSQLLLRDTETSKRHVKELTTIMRSGEHLMAIINNILDTARIESGRITLNPAPFDLHLLLDDLERMFSLRTQAKNLRFHVERQGEVPRCILADETKLRQIIINLLGNAVKFTASGGAIILRVRADAEPDGIIRLHMEVEDTGAGIAPEDIAHMFQAFFQTNVGKKVGGGTGLGLSISRQFVRLMGGDLTVSSQPGIGSTFRFNVLVARGDQAHVLTKNAPSPQVLRLLPGQPACRVLVVDDQQENRDLLERMLAPIGFELRTANDGAEAVALCKEWLPRLAILDLRMPVMDGFEATRRIRAEHGLTVKIIALSAGVFAENQQMALDAGADMFLGKPFQEGDLLEQIKQLTGVDYVYRDVEAEKPAALFESEAKLPTAVEIGQLPAELVNQLREAMSLADYNQMRTLVEEMAAHNQTVSRQLRQLVERFDYITLQKVLELP